MRLCALLMLVALITPFSGKVAHAQEPIASLAPSPAEGMAAARLRIASPPVSFIKSSDDLSLTAARPSKHTGRTLMIVGGAVFVAGLLADEAIISITGVAVGAYGLYVYLEGSDKKR